jgi:hypothetical protein
MKIRKYSELNRSSDVPSKSPTEAKAGGETGGER